MCPPSALAGAERGLEVDARRRARGRPSVERESVSGTAWKTSRSPSTDSAVRQTPSIATEPPIVDARRGAAAPRSRAAMPSVARRRRETTEPTSRTIPVNTSQGYSARVLRLADVRLDEDVSPTGRLRQVEQRDRLRQLPEEARPLAREIVGATKSEHLVDEAASRNAVASVGPPSSRSDWTPSARERVRARPGSGAGAELELRAVGQRARARTRAAAAAATTSTSRASSRGASARTVPIPTATASDAARSSWTSRRDSSPVTQRAPGHA